MRSVITWYNHYIRCYNKYSIESSMKNGSKKKYMLGGHWTIDYAYYFIAFYCSFITGYYGVYGILEQPVQTTIPLIISLVLNGNNDPIRYIQYNYIHFKQQFSCKKLFLKQKTFVRPFSNIINSMKFQQI